MALRQIWTKKVTPHRFYTFFVVLSLVMYIFGHSTEFGKLPFPDKLFYIPCAISLVLAAFNKDYWQFNRTDWYFIAFYLISLFYSAIFIQLDPEDMITCAIGYLVFRYLSKIRLKNTLTLLAAFAPFVVAIHYLFSSPLTLGVGYRYGGFQGDPNCFSFAMNVIIYACGFVINYSKNKLLKITSIISIIGIIPLIMAAASRAGVAIMVFLIGYIFWDTIKKNKLLSGVIVAFAVALFFVMTPRLRTQLMTITQRFEDTSENGSDYRLEEFQIVPTLLLAHPEYLLFGIGYSQSLNAHKHFDEYYHEGRAHNTYMSVLLEQGIVGFVLFIAFLISIGKTVFKNRRFKDGNYRMILFFAILFFIFTIYSLPFLPFWFALNVVRNRYDIVSIKPVK
jgi:O-antigen ligase